MAGPQGTVTYRVTLHNQSIIPVQVSGVEAVPGQPLTPVEVQVKPDEGDASVESLRPFTLTPFESVYLLVTSPTVCGLSRILYVSDTRYWGSVGRVISRFRDQSQSRGSDALGLDFCDPGPLLQLKAWDSADRVRRESRRHPPVRRQIGVRLFISEKTVASHVSNILNRLGSSSRAQIAGWFSAVSAIDEFRNRHSDGAP